MKSLLLGLCLLLPLFSFTQQIEWANTVIAFSSQKTDKVSSAAQALGKPNKLPYPGHTTCAWSPDITTVRSTEYIQVGFKNPVVAKQILISENYNPGHIKQIFIYDSLKNESLIYTRTTIEALQSGRLFSLQLKDQKKKIYSVKLVMDEPDRYNPYQIDAIGLTTSSAPVSIVLNEIEDMKNFMPENLGTHINSEYDEIYPIIAPDGQTLYIDRKLHPDNKGDRKKDDIWYSKYIYPQWQNAVNIGSPLNNDYHNFLCSISPDGNTALLGGRYTDTYEGPGVSIANRTETGWGKPKPVDIRGFKNISQYNEFNLSCDGTALLMSIENSETYGLSDLYVSFMQKDGSFSVPRNLGININTAGNETTPFLAADGKTLYFSSNGHPGYGNPDIFMSRRLDDSWTKWSEPANLGNTVNSPEWELYFSIDVKGEYAYFSSGFTTKTNLDIFRIKLPPAAQPDDVIWLKGEVMDRLTGKTIPARIELYNLNDSLLNGYSLSTLSSDYSVLLQQQNNYRVKISSEGYYISDTLIQVTNIGKYTELIQNFSLIPKREGVIIEMKNILFKTNSAVLEDTSYAELDKVVNFLKNNPGIHIEVRGHTNGLCDDDYCNSLSLRRAKTVADYFTDKGIVAERLSSKGYGKTLPVDDNKTPEGRLRNQRVEFMITKVE